MASFGQEGLVAWQIPSVGSEVPDVVWKPEAEIASLNSRFALTELTEPIFCEQLARERQREVELEAKRLREELERALQSW